MHPTGGGQSASENQPGQSKGDTSLLAMGADSPQRGGADLASPRGEASLPLGPTSLRGGRGGSVCLWRRCRRRTGSRSPEGWWAQATLSLEKKNSVADPEANRVGAKLSRATKCEGVKSTLWERCKSSRVHSGIRVSPPFD